jgi:hypothetical protein
MTKILECMLDDGETLAGKSTTLVLNSSYPPKYLLGLLNSKVMSFFFQKRFSGLALQGGFYRVGPPQIQLLPIPHPDKRPSDAKRLQQHVGEMIELSKRFWAAKTNHEKAIIERNLETLETRIDQIVYRIFSLTDNEIAIIEGTKQATPETGRQETRLEV